MKSKNLTKIKLFTIILITGILLFQFVAMVRGAVTLVYFNANAGNQQVTLKWETASEVDMLGFYVRRSTQQNSGYIRISDFIFTEGSAVSGLVYEYIDTNLTNGQPYYYELEAVDNDYESEFFGPVLVTVGTPATPNTTSQTNTITSTSQGTAITQTITFTNTLSPTINLSITATSSRTATSPFSFITNTPTPSSTPTSRVSATLPTMTETETPEFTRTFEIKGIPSITPSMTATIEVESQTPFRSGLIGFVISFVLGSILLLAFIIIQRKKQSY